MTITICYGYGGVWLWRMQDINLTLAPSNLLGQQTLWLKIESGVFRNSGGIVWLVDTELWYAHNTDGEM
jgi:hypothetical protein